MRLPILWIYSDAHGTIKFSGDDVVEDVVSAKLRHGDPVVQRISPVDTSRQPVDRQAVDLCRYARIDDVQWNVIRPWYCRCFLSVT